MSLQPKSYFPLSDCFIRIIFISFKVWNYTVFHKEEAKMREKFKKMLDWIDNLL